MNIDLVYLWVDGGDPKWQEKKQRFTNSPSDNSEANALGRYIDSEELRYSLRSAEKHVDWINNIFIITDDQIPYWLNTDHPKIKIIDHTQIMPLEILPTFNSCVIEYFLHKIPGLSEYFLFANDDMFFNADLSPNFFFASDGYPIVRLKRKLFSKLHHGIRALLKDKGQYRRTVTEAMNLVERRFGKYFPGLPHHNVDSFRKSDYRNAAEDVFLEEVKKSQHHRTRMLGDLQRSVFSYYPLAIGHAHLRYVGRSESSRFPIYKHKFKERIVRYKPLLFCLNDDQHTTHEDREKVKPFLESLFPSPSSFER
jgi:hypothetical protein